MTNKAEQVLGRLPRYPDDCPAPSGGGGVIRIPFVNGLLSEEICQIVVLEDLLH